ncbi:Ykud domain-containing protein [Hoeflea sp. IMCC20628]|uniref:L,D-transpeptidase n=1 Tax=Hoeflea sp. IMCC20628 TaxID=1620421 RepID=UPI00063AADD1|nr:L,D-transpeptidase [Hoeflea sp. IMCC20628]AKH99788.1 Ykud domain-containing protein [Hoeflea sp. IMCC20628]
MRNIFLAGVLALALMPFSSASAFAAKVIAKIDVSSQTMVISQNGKVKHKWRVSTGRSGYSTPRGTYSPKWLSRYHRSRKYNNAWMHYAVFFRGGYAIHATRDTKRLGRRASHGCVRLAEKDAAKFYSMVEKMGKNNIRIVVQN